MDYFLKRQIKTEYQNKVLTGIQISAPTKPGCKCFQVQDDVFFFDQYKRQSPDDLIAIQIDSETILFQESKKPKPLNRIHVLGTIVDVIQNCKLEKKYYAKNELKLICNN